MTRAWMIARDGRTHLDVQWSGAPVRGACAPDDRRPYMREQGLGQPCPALISVAPAAGHAQGKVSGNVAPVHRRARSASTLPRRLRSPRRRGLISQRRACRRRDDERPRDPPTTPTLDDRRRPRHKPAMQRSPDHCRCSAAHRRRPPGRGHGLGQPLPGGDHCRRWMTDGPSSRPNTPSAPAHLSLRVAPSPAVHQVEPDDRPT